MAVLIFFTLCAGIVLMGLIVLGVTFTHWYKERKKASAPLSRGEA